MIMSWKLKDLTAASSASLATFGPATYVFQSVPHVIYQGFTSSQGSDGHIHELYWDSGDWHHHDLTAATGAPLATFTPATAYAFTTLGTQHVDYTGTDGHVHELYWDSDGWHHYDLTAATGAPLANSGPTSYEFGSGLHVVYEGTDSHIHEL
jgi:hypothetical protein